MRPPLFTTLPTKCQQLKYGYGECKRGLVDMRKRFRGTQPLSAGQERATGAEDQSQGYQLYAGKRAFAEPVKGTDGKEEAKKDWREAENEKYRRETDEKKG